MLIANNFNTPDKVHTFEHGEVRELSLGGVSFSRAVFQPGWRWSGDVKPLVGTESCQGEHFAVVVSGRMHVKMDDGTEADLVPGDAHVVGAGHDAWIVGEEPCVTYDFSVRGAARVVACPCGVSFRVESDDALDHLVAAVQEHARGSHDQEATREHILEEINLV